MGASARVSTASRQWICGRPQAMSTSGSGGMAANIYFAATIPDSTFHWGDDFVVSLDPNGSGGGSPGAGDQQWYLRRVLDSIVVALAENGRWYSQGHEPPMLGSSRHDADWDVASTSSSSEWTI